MKNLLMISMFLALGLTEAHATSGIVCRDLQGGSLVIETDEAAASGDNVLSMSMSIGAESIVLTNVAVDRENYGHTIYIGSDSNGNVVTLTKNIAKDKEGREISEALVKLSDRSILQEHVVCDIE